MVMQLVSLSVYHGLALHNWLNIQEFIKEFFFGDSTAADELDQAVHYLFFHSMCRHCCCLHLLYINHPRSLPYRYWFAVLTVFIYWVSYTALTQPSVFSVIKGYGKEENPAATVMPKLVVHRPSDEIFQFRSQ